SADAPFISSGRYFAASSEIDMSRASSKLILGLALATQLSFVSAAQSKAYRPPSALDIEVYDRSERRVLPVIWHEGRRYVVGKPGNEYALRVRNTIGERILVVMSVDGVNVISGDSASPAQTGYVLGAYENN